MPFPDEKLNIFWGGSKPPPHTPSIFVRQLKNVNIHTSAPRSKNLGYGYAKNANRLACLTDMSIVKVSSRTTTDISPSSYLNAKWA